MLSQRWNPFPVCSAKDEIRSAYAQCAMEFVLRMLSMDLHVKTDHILQLAEHAWKFVPRMLSVWGNCFLVCSMCDKIVSAYAQHAHAIILKIIQKSQIKMQILTIKNLNFEKLLRNPFKRTKENFEEQICFGYLSKTIWFHVCSVTAKTVWTSKFWRKLKERNRIFFLENLPRACKDLI